MNWLKQSYFRSYFFIVTTALVFTSCGIRLNANLPVLNEYKVYKEYPSLSHAQIDSLKKVVGDNKIFVDDFIEPSLIALSHYPELKNTPIAFKFSKEKTTMAARPVTSSLFYKRNYIILINNKEDFDGILLKNVPYNAQVGIIGHELAHIADYNKRNFFGVVGVLFRFLDPKRKSLFEKEIDRETILRGLGWQLYDWADFAMYINKYATEEYKEFKKKNYMKPREIKQYIDFLSRYGIPNKTLKENRKSIK